MCMVSAITDYGMRQWPEPSRLLPGQIAVDWAVYQELLRKAAEYDRITNQPDCVDPAKDKWLKAMEKRVAELEKQIKPL